jgi:hypothetical protein
MHRLPVDEKCDVIIPGIASQQPRQSIVFVRLGGKAPTMAMWKALDGTMSGMLVPLHGS